MVKTGLKTGSNAALALYISYPLLQNLRWVKSLLVGVILKS